MGRTKEAQAGFHARRLLYVIDEAAGVPEAHLAMIHGALTTTGARCLMTGNPTKPSGYFAEAFGRNRDLWRTITVSSEEVSRLHPERVSPAWVADMAAEWGKDHNVYRVQVLGLPPRGEAMGFIPHHLVQASFDRWGDAEADGPLQLGVDVARYGQDASAVCARRGYRVIHLAKRRGLSNPEVAAWVADEARDLASRGEETVIRVDDDGVGGGVTDLLSVMVREGTLRARIEPMSFGGSGDRWFATNAGVWWGSCEG